METTVFEVNDIIAGLKQGAEDATKELASFQVPKTSDEYLTASYRTNLIVSTLMEKIREVTPYTGIAVTVAKFSTEQKKCLVQIKDFKEMNRQAIQWGIIDINPRFVEMIKIVEKTERSQEIWQLTDIIFNRPDFCTLLLELIDYVNPKILDTSKFGRF